MVDLLLLLLVVVTPFRVFHSSVSWLFLTGVWTPIIISITLTFMFHSFFNSLSRYLSVFSFSFNFTQWSARTAKFPIWQVLFFVLIITRSGRLAENRWSVCMSKSQRSLCDSFSRTDSGLYIYHLVIWPIIIIIIIIIIYSLRVFHLHSPRLFSIFW